MTTTPLPTVTPEQYAAIAASIEAEVGKVIVGQADLVRTVITCLLAEGHALLEGVPGLGKTMLLSGASPSGTSAINSPSHTRLPSFTFDVRCG